MIQTQSVHTFVQHESQLAGRQAGRRADGKCIEHLVSQHYSENMISATYTRSLTLSVWHSVRCLL